MTSVKDAVKTRCPFKNNYCDANACQLWCEGKMPETGDCSLKIIAKAMIVDE